MQYYNAVHAASEAVRARIGTVPSIAIVLGSGLGDFAGSLGSAVSMSYGELPNWPVSSVAEAPGSRHSPAALTSTRGTIPEP
jgi:purine-nucleoside phosphorylase